MGGTFMSLPLDYRDWFIRGLHDALSGHSSSSAAEAVAFAEQARTKCIGLTIETRPDYCLTPPPVPGASSRQAQTLLTPPAAAQPAGLACPQGRALTAGCSSRAAELRCEASQPVGDAAHRAHEQGACAARLVSVQRH